MKKKKNGAHRGAMSELLSKAGEAPVNNGAKAPIPKTPETLRAQRSPVEQSKSRDRQTVHRMSPAQNQSEAARRAAQNNALGHSNGNSAHSKKKALAWFTPKTALVSAVALVLVAAGVALALVISNIQKEKGQPQADILLDPAKQKAVSVSAAEPADRYDVKFVFYQKPQVACVTKETTVGNLCAVLGVTLDEDELLKTNMDQKISEDTEINVDNVTYETVKGTESIAFKTRYINTQNVPKGTSRVTTEGKNGVRTIEYKVTYVNGAEMERVQTSSYVTTYPKEQIVSRGIGGTVTIGGKVYNYSYFLDCDSTVYTGGGITASGLPATEAVIAVDPGVIPLRSQVYVEGVGIRTAADTGGVIKGNFIDIYFDEDNPRLQGYGRRDVRVYILG